MVNKYNITVLTNKHLGNPKFIRDLLKAWDDIDPQLKPEFFGSGEPVRHSFAEKGIDYAVETWVKNGMGLMLRRQNKFKYLATIDWFSGDRGLDTRPFPWSCNVLLHPESGDELALKFLKFLIDWFEPAFGYLSTNEQIDEKHFAYIEHSRGSTEEYVGMDIEDTLPGIYWTTYFGPPPIKNIGKKKFESLSTGDVEKFKRGFLIRAYPSSKGIDSQTAKESERRILQHFGEHYFFDKSQFDLYSLLLDDKTDELIDEKIKEMKSENK